MYSSTDDPEGSADTAQAARMGSFLPSPQQMQEAVNRGNGNIIEAAPDHTSVCGMECPNAPDENPAGDLPLPEDLPKTPDVQAY